MVSLPFHSWIKSHNSRILGKPPPPKKKKPRFSRIFLVFYNSHFGTDSQSKIVLLRNKLGGIRLILIE
jgi:hypothetical protein